MLNANLNLPLTNDLKWKDLVAFVELGEGLGMTPEDEVILDVDERTEQVNGLMIFVDPSLIEYRTP